MPKISVEDKVLAILKSGTWIGSDEIERLFPAGEPGHFSWPQRLRGLREQGYTINRRIRQGTKNLSEWNLESTYTPINAPILPKEADLSPETEKAGVRVEKQMEMLI